jgi:hypothetical protein
VTKSPAGLLGAYSPPNIRRPRRSTRSRRDDRHVCERPSRPSPPAKIAKSLLTGIPCPSYPPPRAANTATAITISVSFRLAGRCAVPKIRAVPWPPRRLSPTPGHRISGTCFRLVVRSIARRSVEGELFKETRATGALSLSLSLSLISPPLVRPRCSDRGDARPSRTPISCYPSDARGSDATRLRQHCPVNSLSGSIFAAVAAAAAAAYHCRPRVSS